MKSRRAEILALAGEPKNDNHRADSIPAELNAADLAALFGVVDRTVHMLATKHVLPRKENGKFDTRDSIRRYIEFSRKRDSELETAKVRLATEQADKLELANAAARREMVATAEVEREWTGVLRDIRASLMAVSSRLGTRLPGLTTHDISEIDAEIRSVLSELAEEKRDGSG